MTIQQYSHAGIFLLIDTTMHQLSTIKNTLPGMKQLSDTIQRKEQEPIDKNAILW